MTLFQSNKRPDYRANLSRNGFDLSRHFGFTSAAGQLLPVFTDIASPGDSYYINHDLPLLRTAPMASPAMVDVKVVIKSFFVPMQLMYQPFDYVFYGIKNQFSSSVSSNLNDIINSFPLLNMESVRTSLVGASANLTSELRFNAFRLADMLGLNAEVFSLTTKPNAAQMPNFFPWQLMAYHAIYNYFFRLDERESFDNTYFNIDKEHGNSLISTSSNGNWFALHQVPYLDDYYTDVVPSAIISSPNVQSPASGTIFYDMQNYLMDSIGVGSDANDFVPKPIRSNGFTASDANMQNSVGQGFDDTSSNTVGNALRRNLNTAAIRAIFANEKLLSITGRAAKTYDAQTLAHFGFDVPHDVKHEPTCIGTDVYDLKVGEIVSTSGTDTTPLGEIAGKGYASGNGQQHKFTAPCHGVIMTVFAVVPKFRYYGGFARENAVANGSDLFRPEYDNLGMQPVFGFEFTNHGSGAPAGNDICGYQPRYTQYKRKSDRVSLAFSQYYRSDGVGYSTINNYSSYMLAKRPAQATRGTYPVSRPSEALAYVVNPQDMDNLMLVNYERMWKWSNATDGENWNNTPWLAYARDPFIIDYNQKVKKVSVMSVDSLPKYASI